MELSTDIFPVVPLFRQNVEKKKRKLGIPGGNIEKYWNKLL